MSYRGEQRFVAAGYMPDVLTFSINNGQRTGGARHTLSTGGLKGCSGRSDVGE